MPGIYPAAVGPTAHGCALNSADRAAGETALAAGLHGSDEAFAADARGPDGACAADARDPDGPCAVDAHGPAEACAACARNGAAWRGRKTLSSGRTLPERSRSAMWKPGWPPGRGPPQRQAPTVVPRRTPGPT